MFFYAARTAAQARQVVADLGRLGATIGTGSGTRDLLQQVVDEVAQPAIAHQFIASGEPPWEELEESTVERRQRAGIVGDRPLIATGAGMAEAVDRDRWTITSTEAAYHAPPSYIRHHQEGDKAGHFPARPYVALRPEDAARLDAVGLTWLDGRIRGAGF